jgi:primosomal protein N' (replication factor Y) (superfamily II helicase)
LIVEHNHPDASGEEPLLKTPGVKADHRNSPQQLVDVAVMVPPFHSFTYGVPSGLCSVVSPGKRVLVPFGTRQVIGLVLGPAAAPPAREAIKALIDVIDDTPIFPAALVPFFYWMADYYIHPLGAVIETALPGGLALAEQTTYRLSEAGQAILPQLAADDPARAVLSALTKGPCSYTRLRRFLKGCILRRGDLDRWIKKGWMLRHSEMPADRARPQYERIVSAVPGAALIRRSPQRERVLALLEQYGCLGISALKQHVATAADLVRAMTRDGQVQVTQRPIYRDPLGEAILPDTAPTLTDEQAQAVAAIGASLGKGYSAFVLAGVTGSGKTEVYLHLAEATLQRGLPVLVLVPEIALISQMARAFRARFGERVALLHSGLSQGERFDQWRRIAQNQVEIAIGARSAVFAPFDRLGLLIVDEEHDDSYKQEGALRYNARDMAAVRARLQDAVVVLGSATPSLQSIYNVHQGKFKRIDLLERIDNRLLPRIQVQDLGQLREERGLRRFLSPQLMAAIQATLARREQVLLFLNRRGFAGTLVCASCGQPMLCERCDISLTYHRRINAYQCHYCGYSRAATAVCGGCGCARILRLGVGTEQLQAEMQRIFPAARVARMDRDTIRRKGALIEILKALRHRTIDILVGTQMVAKGHDYPHITLVGVICADLSLNLPDFRAGERTFQLLAQVAGRAGRGESPGEVILQTYNPGHFSIEAARHHDHVAFYRQEIEFRKALQYPPFTRMVQLRINGPDKTRTAEQAQRLGEHCARLRAQHRDYGRIEALGPIEAALTRISGQYRWQLLLKGGQVGPLHRLARELLSAANRAADVQITVDVDPLFLM